ncbi:TIGR00730 family Rossman fold protein [Parendozoicomonas haliclonae]|uniref:Cytokinin riboside 5'-monophosphate phosphoribohydrolase n=1 Tax=Parendozoicomonas haliclonae TaxID=1960125 RepID=A0A1X7AG59_9GAMM|nr:TIGR00730 family Rossman fold protein [Parendozoicomonas haliclonae]SMA39358.1 LOG family protein YvdD [Parendozoicomonas haliclonae]
MKKICVFLGAKPGTDPAIQQAALDLADELVKQNKTLVYGGSSTGLMGVLANRVLEQDGEVIGIIPEKLVQMEVAHQGLTKLIHVESMSSRKDELMAEADGFIALPGGMGTLDELFEALTGAQLRLHKKPVGLLNINGYYDHLLAFLKHASSKGLISPEHLELLIVAETPADLLARMEQ